MVGVRIASSEGRTVKGAVKVLGVVVLLLPGGGLIVVAVGTELLSARN